MNSIAFQQVFYGHDGTGYRVLGASNTHWGDIIAHICEPIGTPDPKLPINPFLISVPYNKCLIAIYVTGGTDNQKRQTLSFHALIAPLAEMDLWNLNAWILFEKQIFQRYPLDSEKPEPLIVTDLPYRKEFTRSLGKLGKMESIVFISNVERTRAVYEFMNGPEINHRKWAGFAYQPLDGFDAYVLSDRSKIPTGTIIRNFSAGTFSIPSDKISTSVVVPVEIPSAEAHAIVGDKNKPISQENQRNFDDSKPIFDLKNLTAILLLGIIALILVCAVIYLTENSSKCLIEENSNFVIKEESTQRESTLPPILSTEKDIKNYEGTDAEELYRKIINYQSTLTKMKYPDNWPGGVPEIVRQAVRNLLEKQKTDSHKIEKSWIILKDICMSDPTIQNQVNKWKEDNNYKKYCKVIQNKSTISDVLDTYDEYTNNYSEEAKKYRPVADNLLCNLILECKTIENFNRIQERLDMRYKEWNTYKFVQELQKWTTTIEITSAILEETKSLCYETSHGGTPSSKRLDIRPKEFQLHLGEKKEVTVTDKSEEYSFTFSLNDSGKINVKNPHQLLSQTNDSPERYSVTHSPSGNQTLKIQFKIKDSDQTWQQFIKDTHAKYNKTRPDLLRSQRDSVPHFNQHQPIAQ